MHTEKDMYPHWVVEFTIPEAETTASQGTLEYKFLKLNDTMSSIEWEPIAMNRKIEIRERASVVLHEVFGEMDKRAETFVNRRPAESIQQPAPAPIAIAEPPQIPVVVNQIQPFAPPIGVARES